MWKEIPPAREYWLYEYGRINKSLGLITPDYLIVMYLNGSAAGDAGLVKVPTWERSWHVHIKEPIQRALESCRAMSVADRVAIAGAAAAILGLFL